MLSFGIIAKTNFQKSFLPFTVLLAYELIRNNRRHAIFSWSW